MKGEKFDVFVIGSGVAGKTVAENCEAAGLKVAVAEKREFGGTCANHGCDPKKVLLGPTEILQRTSDLAGKGIMEIPKLDWKALQKFKKTFTSDIPKETKRDFKEKNITVFSGSPEFIGPNSLKIKDVKIVADKIVIATGLEPRKMDIEGSKFLKQSNDFLSLKKLPKKIIFLGAGYIGMEFAQMAARAGSRVTILDHGDRPLDSFDSDLVSLVEQVSKDLGIEFIYNVKIESLRKKENNFKLKYEVGNKKKSKKVDAVFNTAGRVPAIKKLNLKAAKIAHDDNGITVDEYLCSKTNHAIYACGDVSDHSMPLSPLSGFEANVVSENIINGNSKKIEVPWVPSVVFTIPNVASVGYSEEEAKRRYKSVSIKYSEAADWYNNKRVNGSAYAYKILINDRTDLIVGAHLLGTEAGEVINLFTMAMNIKLKANELRKMIFTYPSWCNDIKLMLT
ncbi:MAG: NAD(P)/FAD-dependent oxidoreductase [Saonia sp.]